MKIKTLLSWIMTIFIMLVAIFTYTYYMKVSPWKAIAQNLFTPDRTKNPTFLFTLGNDAQEVEGKLVGPLAVDASEQGRIYVANTRKHQVNVYDPNGKLIETFGKSGKNHGELTYPAGIKVIDEQILVSEALNGRIQIFDEDGNFLRILLDETSTKEIGGFKPVGLESGSKGQIYVVDALHHRIVITNLKGEILGTFGQTGTEQGQLSYPYDIAVDAQDNIYVTDSNNARVQVFDSEGNFLRVIAGQSKALPFALPRGIAIDQYNRLMVVDAFLHQILVFEPDGTFLFAIGSRGTGDEQLNFPNGIEVGEGRLFITDRENHRVVVYEL